MDDRISTDDAEVPQQQFANAGNSLAEVAQASVETQETDQKVYSPLWGWLVLSLGLVAASVLSQWPEQTSDRPSALPAPPSLLGDINRAASPELQLLPNIGPALAEKIVQFVKLQGPLRELTQLDSIEGIGPKTLERIGPYVTFSSSTVDYSSVAVIEISRRSPELETTHE